MSDIRQFWSPTVFTFLINYVRPFITDILIEGQVSELRKKFLILVGYNAWDRIAFSMYLRHNSLEFDGILNSVNSIVNNIKKICEQ